MSRWKVVQHSYPTGNLWAPWKKVWKVYNPNGSVAAHFDTWREAVDYADRMARTREVVLPRNHDLKKSVHKDINGDLYANYSSANYWAQDNWNKGPKPLALALLALAEQEEHT